MAIHTGERCGSRKVTCPRECGLVYDARDEYAHLRSEGGTCPNRWQRCRFELVGLRARKGDKWGVIKCYEESTGKFEILFDDGRLILDTAECDEVEDFLTVGEQSHQPTQLCNACGVMRACEMEQHLKKTCRHRYLSCTQGCGQRLPASQLSAHIAERCLFRFCIRGCDESHADAQCPRETMGCPECGQDILCIERDSHQSAECLEVSVRCLLGCGAQMRRGDLKMHSAISCPKRFVECPLGCKTDRLWAEELDDHVANSCPLHVEPCTLGCGMNISMSEKLHHSRNACPKRPLTCPCGSIFPADDEADHKAMECPNTLNRCPLGCGADVARGSMNEHMDESCPRRALKGMSRLIPCNLGCGRLILRQWDLRHRTSECPKRKKGCGGCGCLVPMEGAERHAAICPERILRCGADSNHCARKLSTWCSGDRLTLCADHRSSPLAWAVARCAIS
jgi:hypothetical protein